MPENYRNFNKKIKNHLKIRLTFQKQFYEKNFIFWIKTFSFLKLILKKITEKSILENYVIYFKIISYF